MDKDQRRVAPSPPPLLPESSRHTQCLCLAASERNPRQCDTATLTFSIYEFKLGVSQSLFFLRKKTWPGGSAEAGRVFVGIFSPSLTSCLCLGGSAGGCSGSWTESVLLKESLKPYTSWKRLLRCSQMLSLCGIWQKTDGCGSEQSSMNCMYCWTGGGGEQMRS